MLSIEQCRKYLKGNYREREVEEIRDSLYQMATILVDSWVLETPTRKNKDRHEQKQL